MTVPFAPASNRLEPLSQRERAQRVLAGKASAAARAGRHTAETSPSVKQGGNNPPSRAAVGLFRQGQAHPGTGSSRMMWDTRSSEATIGRIQARVKFHFPDALRGNPDPPTRRGRTMARTLAPNPKGGHQDVVILNPRDIEEATRHPAMRDVIARSAEVVRANRLHAIERGMKASPKRQPMIPPGTTPGAVNMAYKHASLLALHRFGLVDYDFDHMDQVTKAQLEPLNRFMYYAHRRVFDQLNVANPGQKSPFREQFGQLYRQKKRGKLTGVERMRMRPNERFVKMAKMAPMTRDQILAALHQAPISDVVDLPAHAIKPHLHIAEAAAAIEAHHGVKRGVKPRGAMRKVWGINGGFKLGTSPNLGGYNTDPKQQLRRAMRPRIRRRLPKLRLNTQKHLRHLLGGGVTRQERWQLGAKSRLPRDPFNLGKLFTGPKPDRATNLVKRYLDKPEGEDSRTWNDGKTPTQRAKIIAAARATAEPTEGQAKAGNYRMGRVRIAGMDISIETPKGRLRRGKKPNGHFWSVRMPAHYGYIRGTEGADGDHLDAYLGPHAHQAENHPVFVVDQQHADTRKFDEHKAMIGFRDEDHATRTYDAAFSDKRGPERRKAVHQMTMADFKHWVGNANLKHPAARTMSHLSPRARARVPEGLNKGLIGEALSFGARHAPRLKAFGVAIGRRTAPAGRVARKTGAAIAGTKLGQATGRGAARVARIPPIARGLSEVRAAGGKGFVTAPVYHAGRTIGGAIGGARGAKIGGNTALVADYTPDAFLGYHVARGLVGAGDKESRHARKELEQSKHPISRLAGEAVDPASYRAIGRDIAGVGRKVTGALGGSPPRKPRVMKMFPTPGPRGLEDLIHAALEQRPIRPPPKAAGRLHPAVAQVVPKTGRNRGYVISPEIKQMAREHLRALETGHRGGVVLDHTKQVNERLARLAARRSGDSHA